MTDQNARRSERVRTMLGAQLVFNNRMSSVQCQVRNMSDHGARLALSNTMALPQEFELEIPAKGKSFRAQLRWRSADAVGVEFIDREAGPVATEPSWQVELRRLENENAQLRARLRQMTAEFERAGLSDRESA